MKKKVQAIIASMGGASAYCGKTQTMYINNNGSDAIELAIIGMVGYNLPFGLATNPI